MEGITVGSVISVKLNNGEEMRGKVRAYNPASKLLIIASAASNGNSFNNDMNIINVDVIENLTIEGETQGYAMNSIDYGKLEARRDRAVKKKQTKFKRNVLFKSLKETTDNVVVQDDKIVVQDNIVISPPYSAENVERVDDPAVVLVKAVANLVEQKRNSKPPK